MKLLEEKGIREKVINECIKMENELQEYKELEYDRATQNEAIDRKINHLQIVDKIEYAKLSISDLRTRLLCLFDEEKK